MIEPRDYTNINELLSDLSERAWADQAELYTHGGTKTIHIPSHQPDRQAICKNQPTRGRTKPTSAFPAGWRDGMEWCPYCLTREYLDITLERVKTLVTEDMTLDGGAVIRAGERKTIYHTRECGLWPTRVRAATNEEVEIMQQCERCQQIERGDRDAVGSGDFIQSVLDGGSYRTPVKLVPAIVQKDRDAEAKL